MIQDLSFDQLVSLYLDDEITADQFDQLSKLIAGNAELRGRFLKLSALDFAVSQNADDRDRRSTIEAIFGQAEQEPEDDAILAIYKTLDFATEIPTDRARRMREALSLTGFVAGKVIRDQRVISFLAAASLMIGVVIYISLSGQREASETTGFATDNTPQIDAPRDTAAPVAVAMLTNERGAVWDRQPGQDLYAGQSFTLTQGMAELTTARGAVALIEAPATIELLDNDNALRLHAGKLVGICETKSSQGFLVLTPHMDVTDLGTRFGVDASGSDATEVHVFEGKVELTCVPAGLGELAERVTLEQGQAVRLDRRAGILARTPLRRVSFTESLETQRLRGTGVGLALNQVDPAWRIIAVDGQMLASPLDMIVSIDDHSTNFRGDSERGRWLRHRDVREPAPDRDRVIYTVQTELWIPPATDLNTTTMRVLGYIDDALSTMRFNDRSLTDLAAPAKHSDPLTYSATLQSLGIAHGSNQVQFDIANIPRTPTGLLIQWQLFGANQTEISADE